MDPGGQSAARADRRKLFAIKALYGLFLFAKKGRKNNVGAGAPWVFANLAPIRPAQKRAGQIEWKQ